nr:agamous-like MADS-box protein AGL61 [Coffea arabica]
MAKKLTRGHQKVPIVEMEKNNNLHVTFSKRRNGLFMKANELCTLTGAEVALLVSLLEKGLTLFVIHLSNLSLISLLETSHHLASMVALITMLPTTMEIIDELNNKIIDLKTQLKANKKREEVLGQMIKEGHHKNWWQAPIGEMNLEQLLMMKKALEELKKKVQDELKCQI